MLYFCDTDLHNSSSNIPKVSNKTEKNYDEQFIIMKSSIEANKQEMKPNKQDSDEKMTKFIEEFKEMLA